MKKILLASNNQGKVERFKNLTVLAGLDIEIVTPAELSIKEIEVIENGATLADNAEIKARAYFGKVNVPIIANDTGFWTDTEGFIATPKRIALQGEAESVFSEQEISQKLLAFWKQKATDNGGAVDAAWVEAFILVHPDGTTKTARAKREVILTDTVFGEPHPQMPVRALYISKITNKPAVTHTPAEELEEMQPVIEALKTLLAE